ncbi:hypothetical protein COLO4_30316 [Corchorus olitorius]|uniref:EGF-like domain-containing protein n=1 Tax=Corchorus olitorius TaxID=93759 RepID=A0A1R3H9A7_9ROSI|nr:hypothetical protein COLO4_30316 [Corchorus olitorius]
MESLNFNLFSFLFLILLCVSTSTVTATSSSSHVSVNLLNPFEDIVCSFIQCGQGSCKASNKSLLGFDCECNPGWKKIQIGPFTFPACLIPNYCDLVWCGDGKCVSNGTGHICQCDQGSENLFGSSELACFKPCYLGADCEGLGLNLPLGHPQPPPPPPPSSSSSDGHGFKSMSKCLGTLCRRLSPVAVAAAFLSVSNKILVERGQCMCPRKIMQEAVSSKGSFL